MVRSLLAAVLVSVAVTLLAIFTTTIYLHRALAHRAVTLSGRGPVCGVVVWMSAGIRPRQWVNAIGRRGGAWPPTASGCPR